MSTVEPPMSDERSEEARRAIEAILMVATDPVPANLLAQLLEVSTRTVEAECRALAEAFEAEPFAQDALALRSFDDGGKVAGLEIPALDEWRPLLDSPGFRL